LRVNDDSSLPRDAFLWSATADPRQPGKLPCSPTHFPPLGPRIHFCYPKRAINVAIWSEPGTGLEWHDRWTTVCWRLAKDACEREDKPAAHAARARRSPWGPRRASDRRPRSMCRRARQHTRRSSRQPHARWGPGLRAEGDAVCAS
jgi:hypothetical protein